MSKKRSPLVLTVKMYKRSKCVSTTALKHKQKYAMAPYVLLTLRFLPSKIIKLKYERKKLVTSHKNTSF